MTTQTFTANVYASRPALRITRRGRMVLSSLVAIASLLLALFVVLAWGVGAAEASVEREAKVVVQEGQTLWGIATSHYPDLAPEQAIWKVRSVNDLRSDQLVAGTTLVLPSDVEGR
ncbi:LysM peptidoglycan-binding domain-containing protein [Dermabacteraceae bacterium P13077]